MAQLHLSIVTPEATVLDGSIDFVALPLYDGEIGIAPGHGHMIGRMGYGELRAKQGEKVSRYYVDAGFVEVSGDTVSVLTNRAIPAEKLNLAAIQEQLAAAQARVANSPETFELRDRAVAQARGQLRVAQRK